MSMKRQVSYRWRLREMMAARGVFTATELVPLLHERGIDLSASQVHRLVTGTPEWLSLPVLAALCDILEVTPPTWSSRRGPTSRRARPSPATPRRRWTWPRSDPGVPACDRTDESYLHRPGRVNPTGSRDTSR